MIEARHEEADTRIISSCVKNQVDSIVVQARDTGILVLLLARSARMFCTKFWLKAGTVKKRKYIPVHTIVGQMSLGPTVLGTIPAFDALTGSDVTTFSSGNNKSTAWKVFTRHHGQLQNLGNGDLTERTAKDAELQNVNVDTVDRAGSAGTLH